MVYIEYVFFIPFIIVLDNLKRSVYGSISTTYRYMMGSS